MSEVITNSIAIWRQKAQDGTITTAEMREAIIAIRTSRFAASTRSDTSRAKKAAKAPIDADALLNEFF